MRFSKSVCWNKLCAVPASTIDIQCWNSVVLVPACLTLIAKSNVDAFAMRGQAFFLRHRSQIVGCF
jgi:hypothetical protein